MMSSIPNHQMLFFPGNINPKDYEDSLMVEPNEYSLIKFGERGTCLYRCGNERYLLVVIAPESKEAPTKSRLWLGTFLGG